MKICRHRLLSGAILIISSLLTPPTNSATVTSCDEAGLRAAIVAGGMVNFACDGVITLTNAIAITGNLVLDGNNRNVAISGNSMVRIFNVETGASLTVHNLELRDGTATGGLTEIAPASFNRYDGFGGAIANTGSVWAVNCRFTGNSAIGRSGGTYDQFGGSPYPSSGCGGAIFNAGNLVLTNCTFSGNQAIGGDGYVYLGPSAGGAGLGGAVFNAGSATISRCVLLTNTVSGGNGGDGPGISYPVTGAGGGIGAGGSIFSTGLLGAFETLFEQGGCRGGVGGIGSRPIFGGSGGSGGYGGAAQGGAIYCSATNIVVSRCTFSQNHVESGNGGDGVGGYESSTGRSGNGGWGGNGGNVSGAAIHVESGGFSATNITLYGNTAISGKGGNGGNGGSCPGNPPRGAGGDGGNGGNGGAILGAGIYVHASHAVIIQSTIADNRGFPGIRGNGGGAGGSCYIYPNGSPGLPGSSGTNHANNLFSDSIPVSIRNTILTTIAMGNGCSGNILDAGNNLSSESNSLFNASTSLIGADPNLGPLANNGGPTLTMSPLPGSPAIDAGNDSSAPATDQRGVPRPQGIHVDIGAMEATFLRIERLVDGNVRLRYAGIPGDSYTLEGTFNLSQPWFSIETKPAGSNGGLQYLDLPDSAAQQMFRVKTP